MAAATLRQRPHRGCGDTEGYFLYEKAMNDRGESPMVISFTPRHNFKPRDRWPIDAKHVSPDN